MVIETVNTGYQCQVAFSTGSDTIFALPILISIAGFNFYSTLIYILSLQVLENLIVIQAVDGSAR
jgi:hypothetical protein